MRFVYYVYRVQEEFDKAKKLKDATDIDWYDAFAGRMFNLN